MEKLEQTTAIKWFPGRGVEENWINEAEEELGFTLPPSYCWWLRNYGNAFLDDSYIQTLTSSEFRDISDEDWCKQHPHRLALFVPDSGELYYFDTSSKDSDGEFKIMCYDLMNGIIYEYAPTFADFLEKLIGERI
ncbi:SMI1/KNR4 family protein [Lysinibacillus pakistanensis]|uniref:SMI1/KNR4 family protein n=1 Tax=Lysinibacillus pakistanensis TaxID=759811 RepID=A0AAX3WXB8_9BACI|nr:SMI1/KNR4 family protein [Lysinibacillus pakistanensis]MDM5230842.1 SMI1/KNR4 family protein [Lysinibacillus pakistanensis]WHY46410.1 SMI1/KNR4 family protein [Lysinibacillus pakistanensis]WHY51423.1 SMI1/KNR4 family protein [Lysinibacillus pakistanensis]